MKKIPISDFAVSSEVLFDEASYHAPNCLVHTNFVELNEPLGSHHLRDLYVAGRQTIPAIKLHRLPTGIRLATLTDEDFIAHEGDRVLAEQVRLHWTEQELSEALASDKRPIEQTGEALLLARFGVRTWGHWLIELLPKAVSVEKRYPGRFRFVVPETMLSNENLRTARQSLEAYGIGRDRLLPVRGGSVHRFTNLFAVSPVWFRNRALHPELAALMRSAISALGPVAGWPERIALLRRESPTRGIVNTAEICGYLEARGWSVVDIARFDFLDQARLIAGCKGIVSVLGSGLSGLVYAAGGVRVATLAPSNWSDVFFYSLMQERRARLADIRGLSLARQSEDTTEIRRSPFSLDVTALERGLRALGFPVEPIAKARPGSTAIASNWPPVGAYQMVSAARTSRDDGNLDEAEKQLRQAIEHAPADLAAWVDLADVLMLKGRLPEALEAAEQGMALCPSVHMLRMVEDHLKRFGRDEHALEFARRGVALDEADSEAKVRLGHALARVGRFAEAAVYFEQALQLRGHDEELRSALDHARAAAERAGPAPSVPEAPLGLQPGASRLQVAGTSGEMTVDPIRRARVYMGYIDIARPDRIAGWAADPEAPDDVVELAIIVGGREVGRVKADRLRHDLRRSGKFGQGRHGFEFAFNPPLDPGSDHDVLVRIAGTDAVLPRGAFRLRRQADAAGGITPPAVQFYDLSATRRDTAARPRYVIHVGMPKTGTKYLQHNFRRLRRQLQAQGVYYPSEWWDGGPILTHHDLAVALRKVPGPRVAELFLRLNACGSPIVLLSSEGFNDVPASGLEYLRDLTQGARIEIIFYARRWSDWIPSQWQQAVKEGFLRTLPEWYSFLMTKAEEHPGINQAKFLKGYGEIFGRQNIRLVSYSNLADHKIDIFNHFCSSILHVTLSDSIGGDGDRIHESMGVLMTELMRVLNAREVMRSAKPGIEVFEAYHQIAADPAVAGDVAAVFHAMRRHIGETILDDDIFFLRPIYDQLNQYRDLLVSPEYGDRVFAKQRGQCRYVRPDYLLEDGVPDAICRISDALRSRLGATLASRMGGHPLSPRPQPSAAAYSSGAS